MAGKDNLETFDRWIEAHRAHDIDRMLTFVTDDITIQSAAGEAMPPAVGKEQARHHWQTIYDSFPDMRMDAVDVTGGDPVLFAEISHGGTMQGPMGPNQPTGKGYRTQGAFRLDFSDGKIRAIRSYWDTATMARQLGLTP